MTGPNIIDDPDSSEVFTISGADEEMLVQFNNKGEMKFGPNYRPDEAAKLFWGAIIANFPPVLLASKRQFERVIVERCAQICDKEENDCHGLCAEAIRAQKISS